jgi:hypothetical protein
MPVICSVCHQAIAPGEAFDTFAVESCHTNPHECVAAAVRAKDAEIRRLRAVLEAVRRKLQEAIAHV